MRSREPFACPECGIRDHRIIDSRPVGWHRSRRYQCANGHRFSTQEVIVPSRRNQQ